MRYQGTRVARGKWASVVTIIAALFTLAACGSNAASGSNVAANSSSAASSAAGPSSGQNSSSQVAAAAALIKPYQHQPTTIYINTPLKSRPKSGKVIGWLNGNISGIAIITPGFLSAAKALGWTVREFPYNEGNPISANTAMQEAVNAKVNFIAISGLTSSIFGQALANAKAAKIPVFEMDDQTEPNEHSLGIAACIACNTMLKEWGQSLGAWMIVNSNASAHVLYETIPQFSSLTYEGNAEKQELANCSGCTFATLNSTVSDLTGGKIPGQVAAYLQTHPSINYVDICFGEVAVGVRKALDTVGISKNVKIVTADPTTTTETEIQQGHIQAAMTLPEQGHAWRTVDAMARYSEGMSTTPDETALMDSEIWTAKNVPNPPVNYQGAVNYQGLFKKLWHLSG